jgi:hypothetical protein
MPGDAVVTLALGLFASLSAGCSPNSPNREPCSTGFLGDAAGPPQFDVLVLRADLSAVSVQDGGAVPLVKPPQGGRAIFVGVRATNVDGCGLMLEGALRDPATRQVRPDSRTVNLIAEGNGWGVSGGVNGAPAEIANFSNILACANQWSKSNVDGNQYDLEVTIQDRGGRTAHQTLVVTPYCSEPSNLAECICICRAGYMQGDTCDAGSGG